MTQTSRLVTVSPLLTGLVMDEVSKLYPLLSRPALSDSTDLYHAITRAISLSAATVLPPRDRMSDSSHWTPTDNHDATFPRFPSLTSELDERRNMNRIFLHKLESNFLFPFFLSHFRLRLIGYLFFF